MQQSFKQSQDERVWNFFFEGNLNESSDPFLYDELTKSSKYEEDFTKPSSIWTVKLPSNFIKNVKPLTWKANYSGICSHICKFKYNTLQNIIFSMYICWTNNHYYCSWLYYNDMKKNKIIFVINCLNFLILVFVVQVSWKAREAIAVD